MGNAADGRMMGEGWLLVLQPVLRTQSSTQGLRLKSANLTTLSTVKYLILSLASYQNAY